MTHEKRWKDHVQSIEHDPMMSEFVDPPNTTRQLIERPTQQAQDALFSPEWFKGHSIPVVVVDRSSAEYLDPMGEMCSALEMMLRVLNDDCDEFVFGEPFWAEWLCVKPTT